MATLQGALTTLGEDGVRGAQVALKQAGGKLLGKEVEQGKVSIIVGPLPGSEGISIRDYSKAMPNVTFVNGSSGARETTCVTPSPRFSVQFDGSQWMGELGTTSSMRRSEKIVTWRRTA